MASSDNKQKMLAEKNKHVQLLLNETYTLQLNCSDDKFSRSIPAGALLIVFRNKSPLFQNETLQCCEKHAGNENSRPVFDVMGAPRTCLFKFQKKHWGICWKIPEGSLLHTESLPIKFICSSSDASYSSGYTKWDMDMFYSGHLADFTMLPKHRCFKVLEKLKREDKRLRVKKVEQEPLTIIKSKDWESGEEGNEQREEEEEENGQRWDFGDEGNEQREEEEEEEEESGQRWDFGDEGNEQCEEEGDGQHAEPEIRLEVEETLAPVKEQLIQSLYQIKAIQDSVEKIIQEQL